MKARPRVLVVDDETLARRAYAARFAAEHDTRTASSADEALQEMQREPADVVLLGGGIDVLKALKKGWPQTEVVVISSDPSIESAKDAVRNGAFDYLAKPVGPEQVTGAARKALAHKQWALRTSVN